MISTHLLLVAVHAPSGALLMVDELSETVELPAEEMPRQGFTEKQAKHMCLLLYSSLTFMIVHNSREQLHTAAESHLLVHKVDVVLGRVASRHQTVITISMRA